jgi:hypothetical protein
MTSAMQAFLLTAGLFGLSFFGIFFFWFAERLRYGSSRKLPRQRESDVKPFAADYHNRRDSHRAA